MADEGPRMEVHTPVNVSYRTTWLPEYSGVTVVVYSTNRPVNPSGYSNCPASARTPSWGALFTTTATGNPGLGVHQVALYLVARVSGNPA